MNIWQKLKEKWNVESDRRMAWIFLIFAITGSSTLFVRKFLYNQLGIDIETRWIAILVKILAIYIIYQTLLWLIGSIMGERKFFTWFIKKMNMRMIGKKPKSQDE